MSLYLFERVKNLTRYISTFKFFETNGTMNALSPSISRKAKFKQGDTNNEQNSNSQSNRSNGQSEGFA